MSDPTTQRHQDSQLLFIPNQWLMSWDTLATQLLLNQLIPNTTCLILLDWTAEIPRNGLNYRLGPVHLSLEDVTVHAGHEVLMEVDPIVCWLLAIHKGFWPGAQASPNSMIKHHDYYINKAITNERCTINLYFKHFLLRDLQKFQTNVAGTKMI